MPSVAETHQSLLATLERYYDEVPRAFATAEELGPFTLFVSRVAGGWPYYARPRLGYAGGAAVEDVNAVLARQRELGVPEAFEWVTENACDLSALMAEAGLAVSEHPLLVLGPRARPQVPPSGIRLEVLGAESPELASVQAAIGAAFGDSDEVPEPREPDMLREGLASGLQRLVGAFDETGPVGGGSHAPRHGVTELTGIAVLPRARGRGVGAAVTARLVADASAGGADTVFLSAGTERVAAIYRRVGFDRIGTAAAAEPASGDEVSRG